MSAEETPAPEREHEYEDGACVHCGQPALGVVILCGPGPLKYHVAAHQKGKRGDWEPVGDWAKTIEEAFTILGRWLQENLRRSWPEYNRAGIWVAETGESYYAAHQVYEVTFR